MDFSLSPYAPGREMPLYNFGNQETEEERKRRELQAQMDAQARIAAISDEAVASGGMAPVAPTPIKETRTIDPVTGETKIKIEGSERDLSLANPNTPSYSGAKTPISPQSFNQQQYNANIGAQESGNRPNIGFHDVNKSTAFGQYGLTQGAYEDARRLNPNLPADIRQATPEQQNQAMNAFTQQNAKYLQGYGIEPTQQNLAAAHFLGAKGLSDFMTKRDELGRPYISPQAQAANGGYEKAAAIANARLGGQAAAASGATNIPTAMPGPGVAVATGQGVQGTMTNQPVTPEQLPANQGIKIPGLPSMAQMGQQAVSTEGALTSTQLGIQRFQDNQDNLDELIKMRNDANVPDYIRKRSADRAYELLNTDYNKGKAQTKYDEMVANGDQMGIAKAISSRPKDEEGSWLKMIALGFISPQLAGQEAIKLGLAPTKWGTAIITGDDGKEHSVEVQTRVDGKILQGQFIDGTKLNATQLEQAAGQLQNPDALKTAQTQATQAYTSTQQSLMKQREALAQRGADEATLASRGLDLATIQRKAQEAGRAVIDNARRQYRPVGTVTTPAGATTATGGSQIATVGAQPATKATKPAGVLDNWQAFRPGETTQNYDKRQQYTTDEIEAEARQLVSGDKTLREISGRDAGQLKHFASLRAKELDPTWSATDSDARKQALNKWTNPDSNVAKQVRSHITASNSIQDVKQAFDALQNGNVPLFNEIRNSFRTNTGVDLPINAKTGAMLLGPEIIKSIIPGGGGVTERLEAQHLMGVNLSPAQQKAVFKTLEDFQGNSLKALETDWTRAKLPKDQFRERVLGGSPAAQELYDAATKHQNETAARRAGLSSAPSQADIDAEMKRRGLK